MMFTNDAVLSVDCSLVITSIVRFLSSSGNDGLLPIVARVAIPFMLSACSGPRM